MIIFAWLPLNCFRPRVNNNLLLFSIFYWMWRLRETNENNPYIVSVDAHSNQWYFYLGEWGVTDRNFWVLLLVFEQLTFSPQLLPSLQSSKLVIIQSLTCLYILSGFNNTNINICDIDKYGNKAPSPVWNEVIFIPSSMLY